MEMMGLPALMTVMGGAQLAGTAMSMIGAHNAGEAAKNQANFEANQLSVNANNAEAAAERKTQEQDKETKYVLSNAQAAAAASGGSATDPSVVTNLKTIAGEGRYRSLADMYEGDSSAQAMRTQASVVRHGGDNAARAGNLDAAAKGLSGAGALFNKYSSTTSQTQSFSNPVLPWLQPGYGNAAGASFYGSK